MAEWALIAHGGARGLTPDQEVPCRVGMATALAFGRRVLEGGGTALDAVEAVVRALEDDPTFNAGTGSVLNDALAPQMDASIMDGETLDIGAVIGLTDVLNPVSVARGLLKEKPILLAGAGAAAFARRYERMVQYARSDAAGCDTVGCVARDRRAHLAVATSTGGLAGSLAGRVGDVPLPGCGFYADDERGAVSLSGEGEAIARLALAMDFLTRLKEVEPAQAAQSAIRRLDRVRGEAGLIAITAQGQSCWDHNSPHFTVGIAHEGRDPEIHLKKPT